MKQKWIDVSVPIKSGMARWPDNPPVRIEKMLDMNRGDRCTVSTLSMGSHTGTHMDAPLHFIKKAKSIDQMPFTVTVGPARVVQIRNSKAIDPRELKKHKILRGERILFKTRNSARCWKTNRFLEDFVYISEAAAKFLVRARVRLVGTDYLSVGRYKADGARIHRTLLSSGIWIIEGLNLSQVKPGKYELICLPLRMVQGDGAPARAILRAL